MKRLAILLVSLTFVATFIVVQRAAATPLQCDSKTISVSKGLSPAYANANAIVTRRLNNDGTESVTVVKDPGVGLTAGGNGQDPSTFNADTDPQVFFKLFDAGDTGTFAVTTSTGPTRVGGSGAFQSDSGIDYRQVMFTSTAGATVDMSITWILPSAARTHTITLRTYINWNLAGTSIWPYSLAACNPAMTVTIFTYNCWRGDTPPCGSPVNADVYRDSVKIGTATTGGYFVDYPSVGTHSYYAVWSGYSSRAQTVTGSTTISLYVFTPF